MVRRLPMPIHAIYAELSDRSTISQRASDFPVDGSFFEKTVSGRAYWYFRSSAGKSGRRHDRYIGPDNQELLERIAEHRQAKESHRERRMLVSTLNRAGLPMPNPRVGAVLGALADAGIFRRRAVVVGAVAFQAYSGLLGVLLGDRKVDCSELDLAQFQSVSDVSEDRAQTPFGDLLKAVDPQFIPIFDAANPGVATCYAAGDTCRVNLLTPKERTLGANPVPLPSLRASARPMRFLDFLISQDVQAVILFGAGVAINVPAPERFALYTLLIGCLGIRTGESPLKSARDLRRAAVLIDALSDQRPYELRDLWTELTDRGPGWSQLASEALAHLDSTTGSSATREKFQHVIDMN